ncbi:bacillolysin/thermolysin [Tumebacillus sp. BK434]|uniref:M4 family metallopeptidase n=1 Tax=Tumebacillus sp. BK434 TaxID=2512169 RepID=UPI0010492864|nr:M4 family metallopeptidase [Tumebacillus sp. BK434]TCP57634.1 bacillolysin/thermolysin [Tumebacillus sp. BK434]
MNKKLIATLVLTSVAATAFTMNAGAANDTKVLKDEKGAVHNVVGKLGKVTGATSDERAFNALDKVKGNFGFASAKDNFKVKKAHKDENGTTHTRMDQMIDGVKVFGQQVIVHEANGDVQGVTGDFKNLKANAKKEKVSATAAIDKAIAHTGFTGELSQAANAELVYYPVGDKAVLSYQVGVNYLGDIPGKWTIFVDAVDGSIVHAVNQVEGVAGTGIGVLGDTKTINTTLRSGSYYLEDTTKAMTGMIRTRDMKNGTNLISNFTDADNNWNATTHRAAVDAHYYAGVVYDWYKNNVSRNSINGNGMNIESLVHYSRNYNNAFWNGTYMVYGDGDGKNFRAFSAGLDVIAHELTHGVTEYTSNLVYELQPGALNESWSDAMGAAIEGNNWLMGEDLTLPAYGYVGFRSMSDPEAYGDPAHMSQFKVLPNTSAGDWGGVHTNSGIPNKAFYNFATAIGSRSIAAKIWYTASRDYMTSSTNFSGARAATLQATAALYGSGSSYYSALTNAWSAVGVY